MEKLDMQTPDGVQMNIEKIAALFPNCITEDRDSKGKVKRAIDFDLLRQELSADVVEGVRERYTLNWPGKNKAIATANAPINKTLRPCREESVDFDTTENLYIEGDNLEALKLLQETYLGKVKMIYIDPPYNTGNDFVYDDNFSVHKDEYDLLSGQKSEEGGRLVANTESNGRFHSDWLSMMLSRLRLARNLLRDDGVIFISIDDNEVSNLRKLCDEIFGSDNFIESFVWKKSYGGGPKEKYAVTQHEYVLLYAKSIIEIPVFHLRYDPSKITRYYKHSDQNYEVRGPYRLKPLEATKSMDARPNLVYPIPSPDGGEINPKRQWLWGKERVLKAIENHEVEFIKSAHGETVNYKQYLRDEEGVERGEKPFSVIDGIYTQKGTEDLRSLFDDKVVLQFPKPVELLSKFIEIGCPKNDVPIVMDFFSGSATTAQAVLKLNSEDGGRRKYIMVQLPEACDEKSVAKKAGYKTIPEIGKERIRRAGKKIKEENATTAPDLDTGFRVLKVDSSNMNDVYYTPDQLDQDKLDLFSEHIKGDRTADDLLFQVILDWGVPLSANIEKKTVDGKSVYLVNENDLLACFDQGINEALVKQLAGFKPLRAVFRDDAFESDSLKINVDQIFKVLSPGTEVKSI
jgi:adenine-specific DNA-methyltransferase